MLKQERLTINRLHVPSEAVESLPFVFLDASPFKIGSSFIPRDESFLEFSRRITALAFLELGRRTAMLAAMKDGFWRKRASLFLPAIRLITSGVICFWALMPCCLLSSGVFDAQYWRIRSELVRPLRPRFTLFPSLNSLAGLRRTPLYFPFSDELSLRQNSSERFPNHAPPSPPADML